MHQCVDKSSLSHHVFIHVVFTGRPSATPSTRGQWWKIAAAKVGQGRGTLRKSSLWGTSQTPYPIIAAFPDSQSWPSLWNTLCTCNTVLIASFTSKHSCLYNKVFHHIVFVYLCACLSLISSTNRPAWILKTLSFANMQTYPPLPTTTTYSQQLLLPTTYSHSWDLESILPD